MFWQLKAEETIFIKMKFVIRLMNSIFAASKTELDFNLY